MTIFCLLWKDFDTVVIRDGVSGDSPILLEISGEASNLAVLSTQPSIFIGFFPDSSVQDRGFNITWREVNQKVKSKISSII